MRKNLLMIAAAALLVLPLKAQQPDPNFFIYLCFGQSNMEAGATPADQDKDWNDPRFQFVSAVDMPRYNRVKVNGTPPHHLSAVRATIWVLWISLVAR